MLGDYLKELLGSWMRWRGFDCITSVVISGRSNHMGMRVRVCVCVCVYVYACLCVYVFVCLRVCVCAMLFGLFVNILAMKPNCAYFHAV